jgi:hypothetical protein
LISIKLITEEKKHFLTQKLNKNFFLSKTLNQNKKKDLRNGLHEYQTVDNISDSFCDHNRGRNVSNIYISA